MCSDEVEVIPFEEVAVHRQGRITYPDQPPTGGHHNQCWTDWGVHEKEPAAENWIHNMEHGAVVFMHNCVGGCEEEQAQLEALAEGRPYALVIPYAKMKSRFAAVAWGHRLLTDCFEPETFEGFYETFAEKGPEPEPNPEAPRPRPDVCK